MSPFPLGLTSNLTYDITGTVSTAAAGGPTIEVTPTMNNSVPGTILAG
jgi:hypothetical protein